MAAGAIWLRSGSDKLLLLSSKVFTEQYKLHGKSKKTIDETLRICRDRKVLVDYLKQEEVAAIMYKFMDQDTSMKKALKEGHESS